MASAVDHNIYSMSIVSQNFINCRANPMMMQQLRNVTLLLDMFRDVLYFDARYDGRSAGADNTLDFFSRRRPRSETYKPAPAKDTVCLFGLGTEDTLVVLDALKSYSITPIQKSTHITRLADAMPATTGMTYLLVNVDAMGELEDAVDELIAFRNSWPNVVVVMISAFVLNDDCGSYRKLICDATLRSPISEGRFENVMIAARHNRIHSIVPIRPATQKRGQGIR